MDIKGLRYFIKLAECLNFTHAAKECFITQTAMSQSIAKMEEELGFKLFKRNNRSVELTQAGRYFYGSAYILVKNYDDAVKYSQNIVEGIEGRLKIAVSSCTDAMLMMSGIKKFKEDYPSIDLRIQIVEPYLVEDYTRKGRIDMSISWSNGYIGSTTYDNIVKITEFDPCVVVSDTHPLAAYDVINVEMLNNEEYTFADFKNGMYRSMLDVLLQEGVKPENVIKKSSTEEVLLEVLFTDAIALLPSFMNEFTDHRYKFIRIENGSIPRMPFEIRYLKNNINPVIPHMIETLCSQYNK